MSQTKTIKALVTPADAGRHYGLKISRNGMARCPFHNDTNPSLKLYDDHFYCFACGAHGDVIDLTAKMLGLNFTEAVRRLATDFGIGPNNDPPMGSLPQRPYLSQFRRDEMLCVSTLTEYERILRLWKQEYAPKTSDDPIDDRFIEACQMLDTVEYLADFLCAASLEERVKVVDDLRQNGLIDQLQQRMKGVNAIGRAA